MQVFHASLAGLCQEVRLHETISKKSKKQKTPGEQPIQTSSEPAPRACVAQGCWASLRFQLSKSLLPMGPIAPSTCGLNPKVSDSISSPASFGCHGSCLDLVHRLVFRVYQHGYSGHSHPIFDALDLPIFKLIHAILFHHSWPKELE